MFRYAITSRALFPGDEFQRQAALVGQASRWIADGIDFIQLREKDLPGVAVAAIAREILQAIALAASPTRLLLNSNAEIAVATGVHGAHLPSGAGELSPAEVRRLYAEAGLPAPIVTVSCHTLEEVRRARDYQVDGILFAPVFEKAVDGEIVTPGRGLELLRAACLAASPTPVYALGGVTLQNASLCLDAGAKGIAGIRLFHNR
jgi:thiamine-phosphate pyrophosphorylase